MTLIFLTIGLVGLVFVLLSAFGGHDLGHDAEPHGGAPGVFSLRALAVFLTAFGAVGAVANLSLPIERGRVLVSSALGVVSGLGMGGLYLLAMRMIHSQEASSLVEDRELLNLEGHVTVAIPAAGLGEVSCRVASQTVRRLARTAGQQAVPEGMRVRVTDVYGETVIVEPIG